jgi:hypothetical protein
MALNSVKEKLFCGECIVMKPRHMPYFVGGSLYARHAIRQHLYQLYFFTLVEFLLDNFSLTFDKE